MTNKTTSRRKAIAIIAFIILILTVYLTFGVFAKPMRIEGDSMSPTIHDAQLVFVQTAMYKINYGTVIVFTRPHEEYEVIKRVMGLPGDRIRIADGKIYVNGEPASDPYNQQNYYMSGLPTDNEDIVVDNGELTLGKDEYFVLGDNRANSVDSRKYGGVNKSAIIGKALVK